MPLPLDLGEQKYPFSNAIESFSDIDIIQGDQISYKTATYDLKTICIILCKIGPAKGWNENVPNKFLGSQRAPMLVAIPNYNRISFCEIHHARPSDSSVDS